MENTILPLVTEFWRWLGIEITTLSVVSSGDDIDIRIKTPDSALVIGIHGKNIELFQHLIGRLVERKLSKFVHIHLEVNDYIKMRDAKLYGFIDSKITLVQSSGVPIRMASLTPYERKKAHNYIAEKYISGLSTQSEWEWSERALVIRYAGTTISWVPIVTGHISDDGVGI